MEHAGELDADKTVVVYCEKGIRSVIAIQRLQQKFPTLRLVNLSGGMYAWRKEMLDL
jgi:adenylyltransferase/sulfurtransferase